MKKKIKHLTWNSIRLKFVKRTRIPNTVESLGYIKYFSSISPRPVKTQPILEDTTVRRSLVDREDLKLSLEIGKRPHFLRWAYKRFIYKFFNDFNNQWHLPNIFKYWAQRQDFPTIWKTRFLQTHIEYFSLYVWKFRLTLLQKHHWSTIWSRGLDESRSNISYELFNQPGSWNMQFQISSRRKSK